MGPVGVGTTCLGARSESEEEEGLNPLAAFRVRDSICWEIMHLMSQD